MTGGGRGCFRNERIFIRFLIFFFVCVCVVCPMKGFCSLFHTAPEGRGKEEGGWLVFILQFLSPSLLFSLFPV